MPRKDQDNEENERKTSERSAQQKRIDNAINNKLKDDISDLKKGSGVRNADAAKL